MINKSVSRPICERLFPVERLFARRTKWFYEFVILQFFEI